MAYTLSGRVADALSLLEQATAQADAMGSAESQTIVAAHLSEASLRAGRLDGAMQLARRALALSREHEERGTQALILRILGEIHAHRDPPDIKQAEAHYRQALALADELGMRPLQAHCHHGLGNLYSQIGQREKARAELSTAIDMYRDMEMTFWLPETEAALAEVEDKA